MAREFSIGLDLGGTDLKAGLVDREGLIEHFSKRPSTAASAAGLVELLANTCRELTAAAGGVVAGVAVGVPGVIDPDSGSLVGSTTNLPHWKDHPVRDVLGEAFGQQVEVDNDANYAALGEYGLGAARGAKLALMITVGTGVGCGIVANGRILRGARGGAGEIGHLALGDGSLSCGCEVEACVEPEMCGDGLTRRATAAGLDAPNAAAVFAAAAAGHADAARWIERMADRLGAVIGTLVNVLNPDVVVIGGGVANAGERLLAPVRKSILRYSLESNRRGLTLTAAQLGERAGVVGAGLSVWGSRGD